MSHVLTLPCLWPVQAQGLHESDGSSRVLISFLSASIGLVLNPGTLQWSDNLKKLKGSPTRKLPIYDPIGSVSGCKPLRITSSSLSLLLPGNLGGYPWNGSREGLSFLGQATQEPR